MPDYPPLYLLRHGQTNWNRDRRIQGQMESDLTDLGREQARRQGEILKGLDLPDAIIGICSPQRRTRQTAAIALGAIDLVPQFDARLKEVSMGGWEGQYYADLLSAQPELAVHGIFNLCLKSDGENADDLRIRAADFLAALSGPTVIVSHGIIMSFIRGLVRGATLDEMEAMERAQGVVIEMREGREVTHR